MNDPDRRYSSGASDDDAIFADIIAHLNDEAAEPERPRWPPPEDAATDTRAGDRAGDRAVESAQTTEQTSGSSELPAGDQPRGGPDHWPVNQPSETPAKDEAQPLAAPQGWRVHEVDDEPEEHFEPPPAAPLPVGDLQFWAIIAGMVGGPLLLLYLVFFNRDASTYWVLMAIAMSIGGFVLLVSRMPGQHEDDDDGARL